MIFPRRGVYAITQTAGKSGEQVLREVSAALQGGVQAVQYRDKHPGNARLLGGRLLELCRARQVPLLINDDIELARTLAADGVHLGRDDGDIATARARLGPSAIIGVSCYNDLARALHMQAAGADYVAFGRFFPSGSKPLAAAADLATLRRARTALQVPIVAIGGILPENGGLLLDAGADLLAVIGGLFDHDPATAALAYQALFNDRPPT